MPTRGFTSNCQNLIGHRVTDGSYSVVFEAILGVGAYGVVYKARNLACHGPEFFAVKCLNNASLDARQRHFQRRELSLHRLAASHPSIVSIHRIIESPSIIYVILDYCPNGDLFSMITGSRQPYIGHDRLITSVFLQLIDAVEHCHSLGIFHRDLKPENVLCAGGGSQLLLADFGLATSERSSKDFGCGSTFYMSPECQGGLYEKVETYNTAANDTWSLGVILVNLTCGRNPWRQASITDETFRAFLADGNFLRSILPISRACNEILKGLFRLDPTERISLGDLRQKVKAVRRWNMSEDELVNAHEQARVAAEASGHTTSRRLQARAAVLEQRRLEELAAAAAAVVADSRSPSPPAASSSSSSSLAAVDVDPSSHGPAPAAASSTTTTSSIGVLISGCTSFSAYSDGSDASYVTDDDDDDDEQDAGGERRRRHPASLPVSPVHSDPFARELVVTSPPPPPAAAPVNAAATPLLQPPPPPPPPAALLPPQAIDSSRPTPPPFLRTQPSSASISSCNSSASSAESAFPTTPGAKYFKGHPLPGLESCYDEEDEGMAPRPSMIEAKPPRPPHAAGSLPAAQFALAQLHELEAHGELLLHAPHVV